jgi:two-component SAPR family response regulator
MYGWREFQKTRSGNSCCRKGASRGSEMSVTWHAAADHGAAANDVSRAQPRVLVLQTELLPNLPLVASIARAGFEVVGPLNRISQALTRLEDDPPDAVILDIALRDGISFNLARELLRRKIPFLFYTSWGDMELIPPELREMPLLEKPMHFVLVAKLLAKMIKDGQVLEARREEDPDPAEER